MRLGATVEDIATVSDKAFGLLVLENNWERWKWLCDKTTQQVREALHEEKLAAKEYHGEHHTRLCPPKSKHTLGIGKNKKKNKGWNREGLKKFKQLKEHIKNDRGNKEAAAVFFHKLKKEIHKFNGQSVESDDD